MNIWISGLGVEGPGLHGWKQARQTLTGKAAWIFDEPEIAAPRILSARERRRCSPTVRLALRVAEEAVEQSPFEVSDLCSVFANSTGDTHVVTRLLNQLSTSEKLVSPTDFHNSVHNAPAGYWTIGHGNKQPTTSIAAGRNTFGMGLLKAMVQVNATKRPCLLVCYEHPFPPPLDATYSIAFPMGASILLTPQPVATSEAKIGHAATDTKNNGAKLPNANVIQELLSKNPAADSLLLLECVASSKPARTSIPLGRNTFLSLEVTAP